MIAGEIKTQSWRLSASLFFIRYCSLADYGLCLREIEGLTTHSHQLTFFAMGQRIEHYALNAHVSRDVRQHRLKPIALTEDGHVSPRVERVEGETEAKRLSHLIEMYPY
jgi:hypothetical protein